MRLSLHAFLFAVLFAVALPAMAQEGDFVWRSASGPYAGSAEFVHFGWAILALHDGGVSRTTNGGRTWEPLPNTPGRLSGARMQADGSSIFASSGGLVRTSDAGETWESVGLSGTPLIGHTTDSEGRRYALASEADSAVVYCEEGESWRRVAIGPAQWQARAHSIVSLPSSDAIVVIHADGREVVSTDGGLTWELAAPGDSGTIVTDAIETRDGRVIVTRWVANQFGSSGSTKIAGPVSSEWRLVRFENGAQFVPSFGVAEAFGEAFVGTSRGGYWLDGDWARPVPASGRVREYVPLANPAEAFAGAVFSTRSFFEPVKDPPVLSYPAHGVYRVGADSVAVQRGVRPAVINDVSVSSNWRPLAATDGGVYRLHGSAEGIGNDEQRWERLPYDLGAVHDMAWVGGEVLFLTESTLTGGLCSIGNAHAAVETAEGTVLIAMGETPYVTGGGIMRYPNPQSVCSLESWEGTLTLGQQAAVRGLSALLAPGDGVVLAGSSGETAGNTKLYRSTDDGETWAPIGLPGDREVFDFLINDEGQIWAGTDDGLVRAGLGGEEWTDAGMLAGRQVLDLHRDEANRPLAGTDAGVYRFEEGTWRALGQGLEERAVYTLRWLEGGRLVAGTDRGVWSNVALTSIDTQPSVPDPSAERHALGAPFPNPTASAVTIPVILASATSAWLTVIDVLGREVATHEVGARGPGTHSVAVDTQRLAPGLYVARLVVGGEPAGTRRFTVAR